MEELNPIQRQMWAMAKYFLRDENNYCVCLSFIGEHKKSDGVLSKRFTTDNFSDFIPAIQKYRSGLISFHVKTGSPPLFFEFIYCYEDDAVAFSQRSIPQDLKKYVAELFCESEFLLNIELFESSTVDSKTV